MSKTWCFSNGGTAALSRDAILFGPSNTTWSQHIPHPSESELFLEVLYIYVQLNLTYLCRPWGLRKTTLQSLPSIGKVIYFLWIFRRRLKPNLDVWITHQVRWFKISLMLRNIFHWKSKKVRSRMLEVGCLLQKIFQRELLWTSILVILALTLTSDKVIQSFNWVLSEGSFQTAPVQCWELLICCWMEGIQPGTSTLLKVGKPTVWWNSICSWTSPTKMISSLSCQPRRRSMLVMNCFMTMGQCMRWRKWITSQLRSQEFKRIRFLNGNDLHKTNSIYKIYKLYVYSINFSYDRVSIDHHGCSIIDIYSSNMIFKYTQTQVLFYSLASILQKFP